MIEISQTDFSDGLKATTRIVHWFQDAFTLQKTNMYPTVGKGKESTQKCGLGGDIFPARYRNWLGLQRILSHAIPFKRLPKRPRDFRLKREVISIGNPFPKWSSFQGVVLVGFNNLENRSTFDEQFRSLGDVCYPFFFGALKKIGGWPKVTHIAKILGLSLEGIIFVLASHRKQAKQFSGATSQWRRRKGGKENQGVLAWDTKKRQQF